MWGFIFLKDLSQPADIQQPTVTATQIIHQKYSLTNQFPNSKRISKIPISWITYTEESEVENMPLLAGQLNTELRLKSIQNKHERRTPYYNDCFQAMLKINFNV